MIRAYRSGASTGSLLVLIAAWRCSLSRFLILIMLFASKHSLFPRACNVRDSFNLSQVMVIPLAMILHNTARVALFDTMTKCIVVFQPINSGLDCVIGAHVRAILFSSSRIKEEPQCFYFKK
jgi:hypothetical protein